MRSRATNCRIQWPLGAILSLLVAGCSPGEPTSLGASTSATPGDRCESAFACPEGQRCDEGVCWPDVSCPAAIAPRQIFTGKLAGDHWGVPTIQGHDLVQLTSFFSLTAPGFDRSQDLFFDVTTGLTSRWDHPPGGVMLFEEKGDTRGWFTDPKVTKPLLYTGMKLEGDRWAPGATLQFPEGYFYLGDTEGDIDNWVVFNDQEARRWRPSTGEFSKLFGLEGRRVWDIFSTEQGRQLVTSESWPEEHKLRYFVTPLEAGASPTLLFEVEATFVFNIALIRAGGQWFVIHDHPGSPQTHLTVYRMTPGGQTLVGTTDDPALFWILNQLLAARFFVPETAMKTAYCEQGHCRAVRLDLSTLATSELGAVEMGTTAASVVKARWLACDAVDLLIGTQDPEPGAAGQPQDRLWYTRITH